MEVTAEKSPFKESADEMGMSSGCGYAHVYECVCCIKSHSGGQQLALK